MRGAFDTHAHLCGDTLWSEVPQILERAKSAGLEGVVVIATSFEEAERCLSLKKNYNELPNIYLAAGTHPHDAGAFSFEHFKPIETLANQKKLVAIGEIGLDYFYDHSPKEQQKEVLKYQLDVALRNNLPIIVHCREAFEDFFACIDQYYQVNHRHGPGVLHCFTGNLDEANECLKRGLYISFSGILTFKKSVALQEIAKKVPLEHLLIETDAPFLAPQSKRGKQNEPSYVVEVAQMIASLKGLSIEDVLEKTTKNARDFFRITTRTPM